MLPQAGRLELLARWTSKEKKALTKVDLDSMSMAELKVLKADVGKAIVTFQKRARMQALNAAKEAAQKHGFNLAELMDGKTKNRAAKGPIKYRHPEQPELTWTGAGRKPKWFIEAVDAGMSKEALAV